MSQFSSKATLKILKGSNVGECYTLTADKTLLGRESHCEISLPRTTISRRHAQIVRDAEGFYIEDLDSLNGTYVDGTRIIEPTRLRGGEHIQIDEFLMSFRQAGVPVDESEPDLQTERFVKQERPVAGKQTIRSTFAGQFAVLTGAALRCEIDPQSKLEAVLNIIRNVGTPLDIDDVLRRVLDTLFQIFPQADRGYVFLAEGDELEAVPCASKRRVTDDDPSTMLGLRSNTLAAEVMAAGGAMLCTVPDDTGRGEVPLAGSARAVMAAPLLTPTNATLGVIQLETEDAGRQFIDRDLELLSSIGTLAGQLIEHARLIARDRAKAGLAREHVATERERRRLRAILDILPVGVFITDAKGKLLEANPEAQAIWGGETPLCESPADYARHYRARRTGSERLLESQEFPLARALASGEVCRGEELEIESFDGRRRTILSYARSIQDGDRVLGGVAVNVDITGLKKAEQALTQANQRKDEFLAMLGHELRNPLAPLVSALAVMARKNMDGDTLDWARRLMERQVDHMVRLVDDLLDVSRIERGKFTLRKEQVDFAQVIESAVEASQPLIDAHGHKLELSLPEPPLRIYADPIRLAQVVTNLLNNAAKYMEPGGQIWLTVERADKQWVVKVRDTGIGIAPELLPRVFEPFTQAKQSLDRSQGGLGIGLGLVRKIVELHGGQVAAESEGPGKGSLFTIRLPLNAPVGQASSSPGNPDEKAVCRRVLVVDDQVGQAQVLAKLFTKVWGHEVDVAHDGPSAMENIRVRRPEVVLMDIGLPGINGYELARRIRSEPELADTLLVALTGYGQVEDERRSQEAGFDLHLVKPPSLSTLKEIFEHPRLSRQN
jgi:signal transduction histidine kinase